MRQTRRDESSQRAARAYAILLRLYPRAHRKAFGEQMLQAFQDHYGDAVETDGQRAIAFWRDVAGDEGKSLVREHIAALAEKTWSMKQLLPAVWEPATILVTLALFGVLLDLVHVNNLRALTVIPIFLPIYLALLFLVVRLARSVPRSAGSVSWWRLGLVLGGIGGLYLVALNLLDALAPIAGSNSYGDNVGPVWLLTLPLLAGVVGTVGGYGSGRVRTSAAGGILAGGIMLFLQIASTVLLGVVLWPALQANALHSQLQRGAQDWIQHQWSMEHPGIAPSLWTYLTNRNDDASIAFIMVFKSFYTVIAWPVSVIVGSAIGARAARQARDAQSPAGAAQGPIRARTSNSPAGFTVLLLVLGVLMWSGFTVVQGGQGGQGGLPFLLRYLGASFASPAFFAWLLVFVVMVAAVYLTERPPTAAPAVGRIGT